VEPPDEPIDPSGDPPIELPPPVLPCMPCAPAPVRVEWMTGPSMHEIAPVVRSLELSCTGGG
jgi:hypothetical protein